MAEFVGEQGVGRTDRTYEMGDRKPGDPFICLVNTTDPDGATRKSRRELHVLRVIEWGEPYADAEPGQFEDYTATCGAGSQSYSMGGGVEAARFGSLELLRASADHICDVCFPEEDDSETAHCAESGQALVLAAQVGMRAVEDVVAAPTAGAVG